MNAINQLLYPRGIAVVGSASAGKLGAVLAGRILQGGYKNVYCVNPKAAGIEGDTRLFRYYADRRPP